MRKNVYYKTDRGQRLGVVGRIARLVFVDLVATGRPRLPRVRDGGDDAETAEVVYLKLSVADHATLLLTEFDAAEVAVPVTAAEAMFDAVSAYVKLVAVAAVKVKVPSYELSDKSTTTL